MTLLDETAARTTSESALLDRLLGGGNPDDVIPKLARDPKAIREIESVVRALPTNHELILGDARSSSLLADNSVHLVVTSPPYWTLKRYNDHPSQMGHVTDYDEFMAALDEVWRNCYRALVPGGRLVVNVGDVCLSRRKNNGRHTVVPLHATIQERCKAIGFDNLAPIIWHKIANANYEVQGGGGFLGKPYEPNAVIKNDIEFVLMQRKPGGYRSPSVRNRLLSVIGEENHRAWFRQIWSDLRGTSHPRHPAPYPVEFAERLVRMFSFVGDTVLDPFMGTGTTNIACARWGRNSIGVELDAAYFELARKRVASHDADLYLASTVSTRVHDNARP
ncbi:MAG: site-specific DNA-methyltransferase [Leptolyngbya sp. PLA2]|nr:site-specific DNA-methyltransferase [Leptolyngbya sp. PL-A2]MCQ3941347.1 site-specific DNA-methyltransferase [cyanobacterium CYA1]MCZ7632890.1 site-specific DNA-methyltransferase [Phycisphaerales bacterium]MDL1904458.1 site-specific DNA-methyltransferase [Synechococcales cyanobacterium CNB]GIK19036.1 MAG: methyltransferase [Planctomycetota bacterium]